MHLQQCLHPARPAHHPVLACAACDPCPKAQDSGRSQPQPNARGRPGQAKADQAKADQAKADQAKADQAKAGQAKADQAKAGPLTHPRVNLLKPTQASSTQQAQQHTAIHYAAQQ